MPEQEPRITNSREAAFATLAYFDIFDYPLTSFEIWKYLFWPDGPKTSLEEILEMLETDAFKEKASEKDGYYYLKGREKIIVLRRERYTMNIHKWKKSRRLFTTLLQIPYIRGIALCNMFALNNLKTTSDIDVFVVTEKNHIWSTRLLITFFTWARGLWRHQHKIANRFDLSFYITREHLNLEPLFLKPYDIYFIYWVATLAFVYDSVADEFYEKNAWIYRYLPNFIPRQEIELHKPRARLYELGARVEEKIWNTPLGKVRESCAKWFQNRRMAPKEASRTTKAPGVVINDAILKFHEHDRRADFRDRFEEKYRKLTEL